GFGTPAAVIAVVLLFAVAFSRPLALVIAFVPLFMGLILTAAFAVVSLGHLNAVTATFAALLVGLGIDFVIVIYGRYVEERRAGSSFEEAMAAIRHHTVPSVRLGAVTTAVTFCAFLLSDFAGLWELGLITGGGVLLVMVSVFAVLPAILTLLEQNRDTPPPAVRGFGSRALMHFSHRRPKLILGVNVAATALLGIAALDVVYDDDALNLRSTRNPGLLNQQELMEAFGLRFTPYMVRIDGATEAEAIARAREMLPKLRALADGERLARVESVAPWVPEENQQRRQIERLEAFEKAPEVIAGQVEAALRDQGLNPKAFREGIDQLVEALSINTPQGPSALEGTTVGHLLGRYVAISDDRVSTIIYCYPPPGQWRRFPPPDLVQVVAESEHGAVLTGPVIVSAELKNVVWQDATTAALIGALLVTLFLAFDLGGL
ncbi:MAG: MMPL family transporter, partial [Acidobacteriota bacterium]